MEALLTLTESLGYGNFVFSNGNCLTVGMDHKEEVFTGSLYANEWASEPLVKHEYKNYSDALSLFEIEKNEFAVTEFAD